MATLDVKLLSHQKKLIQSTKSIAGIYGARGSGKSYIISWLCGLNLVQQKKTIVFSTNFKQLQLVLIPEISKRLEEMKVSFSHDKLTNTIRYKNGAVYLFSYENVDSVRGLTECEYLILDEIALAPNEILAVAGPCLRGDFTPKIRFASSPRAGSYWDEWIKNGILDGSIEVFTATMMDNTFLSKESIELQMSAIKDEKLRRQEIYGEILDATIENCIVNSYDFATVSAGYNNHYVCGIDLARYGVDSTCIVVRNANEIIELIKLNKADTSEICSVFRNLNMKYHFSATYLDGTGGYSTGVFDTLKKEVPIFEINFAQKSPDDKLANARTFIYDRLSNAIIDGFFIDTTKYYDVYNALIHTSYTITNSGKRILVPKEDIKIILGRSPDEADALALTFWEDNTIKPVDSMRQQEFINLFFR